MNCPYDPSAAINRKALLRICTPTPSRGPRPVVISGQHGAHVIAYRDGRDFHFIVDPNRPQTGQIRLPIKLDHRGAFDATANRAMLEATAADIIAAFHKVTTEPTPLATAATKRARARDLLAEAQALLAEADALTP